jgi:Heterokaryon incompatibility protein (HET)
VTERERAVSLALYKPLNYSFAQIRLLELLPGCYEDQIRCRLHAPGSLYGGGYEALSYVWGDPMNEMKEILVDDTNARITPNLDTALHCIRDKDKSRYLWIDAVCINQNDHREKNHQVKLMSDIYSRADRVLVFLGLEDGCSEAFDYFDAVSKARDNDSPLPTNNSSKLLLAFWKLLSKPWWSRVWVIQEFVLATTEPFIGCGRRWTTASAFIAGLVALPKAIDFQNPIFMLELHNVSIVSLLRLIRSRLGLLSHVALKHGADLSSLVTISQFHNSTDQRDKIFALNSLMMEPFRTVLAPDYSLSLRTVYTLRSQRRLLIAVRLLYRRTCLFLGFCPLLFVCPKAFDICGRFLGLILL